MVKLNTLETLGSILACLGHDVAHPGVTNRFLVNIKDDLALHYNDNSVLENMHCATIYSLMQKSGCDLLSSLGQEDWFHVRNIVIGMVLATDMSKHFEFIGQFRARVIKLRDMEISELEDKTLAMSMGIKCADLGHSAKSLDLHKKWAALVCDELFAQGDLEKDKFLPVSMYCDRDNTDIDKSQAGFLKNICMPLFEVWGLYLNSECIENACFKQLISNQKYWDDRGKLRRSTLKTGWLESSPGGSKYSQVVII